MATTTSVDDYRNIFISIQFVEILNEHFKSAVHQNVMCNACDKCPIEGLRFVCDECDYFDLCFSCFKSKKYSNLHSRNHTLKLVEGSYGYSTNDMLMFHHQKEKPNNKDDDEKVNASPNLDETNEKTKENEQRKPKTLCDLCAKGFTSYIYQCLICENLQICSKCFEKSRSKDAHVSNHPVIRLEKEFDGRKLFGKNMLDKRFTLDSFKEIFKDSKHSDVTCNACRMKIQGLRFKCDKCYNYDLCLKCYESAKTNDLDHSHSVEHSMIVIGDREFNIIESKEVKLLNSLGRGAFGEVFKAEYFGKTVACKFLLAWYKDSWDPVVIKSFTNELQANREIKGDNIVKILGYSPYDLMIVSEFIEGGSLGDLLRKEIKQGSNLLTYRRRIYIICDVVAGMARIHDLNFIHRDIRPDNILLDSTYTTAKIADFGIARAIDSVMSSKVGCKRYMPREFYTNSYSAKLDIFTFGLTLNELFRGRHDAIDAVDSLKVVVEQRAELFYPIVEPCIRDEPNARPSATELEDVLTRLKWRIDSEIKREFTNYLNENSTKKDDIFRKIYYSMIGEISL